MGEDVLKEISMARKLIVFGLLTLLGGCMTAAEREAQNVSYCESIGLKMGTQDYAACRMMRTSANEQEDAVRRARLECSRRADTKGLLGEARRTFRRECIGTLRAAAGR
jgi:hypothetical protein